VVDPNQKLIDFLEDLQKDSALQLQKPSVRCADTGTNLYFQAPPMLEKKTRPNLELPLSALVQNGFSLYITDPNLPGVAIAMQLRFREGETQEQNGE